VQEVTRKFTETIQIEDFEVLTDTGYQPISYSNITVPYTVWQLETPSYSLECADDHIVFDQLMNEVYVKDLEPGQLIQTESGLEPVVGVEPLDFEEAMYDLTLPEDTDHRYYTNGILSHNTTVLLELLYQVQQNDPTKKVLFISAEMNQLDMARYLKRFPHWGQLPILFMSDYVDANPQAVIEQTLAQGFDLVLTDSYTEVNDTVKEACGLTRGKTEKWFLDLMISHNKGHNKAKKYTTFITILQLSKGGTFVGSNKLKHMTTAMLHLDWKGGENSSERYMEFSKNRLGQVGHKLYFSLEDGISFDQQRYQRDLLNEELIKEEREKLKTEEDAFDKLFSSLPTEAEVAEAE
jgi:hypothetical protein